MEPTYRVIRKISLIVHTHNGHYEYATLESFNPYIILVFATRGVGKTFSVVKKVIKNFVYKKEMFVYVTETKQQIDELSVGNGDKFFSSVIEYLREHPSIRNNDLLVKLTGMVVEEVELESNKKDKKTGEYMKIKGHAVYIGGQIAGYMLALSAYESVKRNNFDKVKTIIFDEVLSENITISNSRDSYKFVSIVESVARTRNIKIYMLSNTTSIKHPLLSTLNITDLKGGEIRLIYRDDVNSKRPLMAIHFVDNKEYPNYEEKHSTSLSGMVAHLFNETQLNDNKFEALEKDEMIPVKQESSRPVCYIKCDKNEFIQLRITKSKVIYIINSNQPKSRISICLSKKLIEQNVYYDDSYKDVLLNNLIKNNIKFDNYISKFRLKKALQLVE